MGLLVSCIQLIEPSISKTLKRYILWKVKVPFNCKRNRHEYEIECYTEQGFAVAHRTSCLRITLARPSFAPVTVLAD